MRRMVIVNSTPILAFHEVGRLDILKELYGEVIIPDAVRREVTERNKRTLDGYGWVRVLAITNLTAKELFTGALHDGEVEVMLLAKEHNAELVIIDDGLARRHAKYLNLNVTGTVGVLLRAKSSGIVRAVRPILDDLMQRGFYLSSDIYREILRLAAE